jgi:hypothetical protein
VEQVEQLSPVITLRKNNKENDMDKYFVYPRKDKVAPLAPLLARKTACESFGEAFYFP